MRACSTGRAVGKPRLAGADPRLYRGRHIGVAFLWLLLFTSGVLPSALRAACGVPARSCAPRGDAKRKWLGCRRPSAAKAWRGAPERTKPCGKQSEVDHSARHAKDPHGMDPEIHTTEGPRHDADSPSVVQTIRTHPPGNGCPTDQGAPASRRACSMAGRVWFSSWLSCALSAARSASASSRLRWWLGVGP